MDDWPFTLKLLAPASVGLAMIAGMSAVSGVMLNAQTTATATVANTALPRAVAMANADSVLRSINGDLYRALALQASGDAAGVALAQSLPAKVDQLIVTVEGFAAAAPKEDQASIQTLIEKLRQYKGAIEFVASMMELDFNSAVSFLAPFETNYAEMAATLTAMKEGVEAGANQTAEEAANDARGALIALVAGALLAAALAAGAALLLARATRRGVLDIARATQDLAEGRTDIDLDGLSRKDELQAVVASLGTFRRDLIERAELLRAQAEAAQEAATRRQSLEQAVRAFRGEFSSLIAGLDEASRTIGRSADDFEGMTRDAAGQSEQAAGSADTASESVQSIAAAVEELAQSIASVADQAKTSERSTDALRTRAGESAEIISRLTAVCADVSQVTALIRDIADKTNLLALNATIEAARAGENGRGFAVVAAEVKALADQTRTATDSIAGHIEALTGSSDRVRQSIGGIIGDLDQVQSAAVAVANAVIEQRAATMEISQSVNMASSGASEAASRVRSLLGVIGRTASSASASRKTAQDVRESVQRLQKTADALLREVS